MRAIEQDTNKLHIASLSGGQDSTAMVIRMLELGYHLDYILFCDTGAEHDEMYLYIKRVNEYLQATFNKSITYLKGETLLDGIKKEIGERGKPENIGRPRGIPRVIGISFCTRDLKVQRIQKFVNTLNKNPIHYIGYTSDEVKNNRGGALNRTKENYSYPLYNWGWNELHISQFLTSIDLFNPLYNYYRRTGCFCCPKQSMDSWYSLYKNYPKHWEESKKIEKWCIDNNAKSQSFVYRRSKEDSSKMEFATLHRLELEFKEREKQSTIFDFLSNEDQPISCLCK